MSFRGGGNRVGWSNPILAAGDGTVIAGHGRLEAARRLGLDTVPAIMLDHLTSAQRRAYGIADNKLALNAGWNEEILSAELHALNGEGFDLPLLGFDETELDRLLAPLGDEGQAGETGEDQVPELPADPVTRPGDLWLLGRRARYQPRRPVAAWAAVVWVHDARSSGDSRWDDPFAPTPAIAA